MGKTARETFLEKFVPGSASEVAHQLLERAQAGNGAWVLTFNGEMFARRQLDPLYDKLIESADCLTCDGYPVLVWLRIKAAQFKIQRVTGVELVKCICEQFKNFSALKVSVIGSAQLQGRLDQLGVRREQQGFLFEGKVDLNDQRGLESLAKELAATQSQIIFLALGVPKQDQLAKFLRGRLGKAVILTVGGSFDILSGAFRRAPLWMSGIGLEWLYRLLQEPRRLWRRYLVLYPLGVLAWVRNQWRRSQR